MTVNNAIALTSIVLAGSLIALGMLFFWQAHTRGSLSRWPPSALVVLGVVPLLTGIIFVQQALFRLGDAPYPFSVNGPGTLAFRLLTAVVVLAQLARVYGGRLLTRRDRTRIVEESP